MPFQRFLAERFTGGSNTILPPDLLPRRSWRLLVNSRLSRLLGVVSSRPGMTRLATGLGGVVYSLWSRFGTIDTSRYLHAGTTLLRYSSTWSPGATLATGIGTSPVSAVNMVDGEGNVWSYATNTSGLGQKKDDGTNFRTWGMPAPANPPTAVALASDLSTTIDAMEASANWTVTSGLSAGPTDEPNIKQVGTNSQTLTIAANTLGLLAKSMGGTTDLDVLSGGDATVKADDYIHLWVRADRPDRVSYLQLDFDIEETTVANAFRTNYYSVRLPGLVWLNQGANQWSKIQVPKSSFQRFGGNTAKSWATVESVRISVFTTTDGAVQLYLDDWKLRGGTDLVGDVRYTVCYRNSDGGTRGNPPLDSDDQPRYTTPLTVDRHRVTVTTSNIIQGGADHPGDTQITHYRLYRSINGGDALQIAEVADGTASPYVDNISTASILLARELETDNHLPPNGHLVFGPGNHNRLFMLFGQNDLAYSKGWEIHENRAENWPPTFRTKIGDGSETAMAGLATDTTITVWTNEQTYSVQGVGADTYLAVPIPDSRGVIGRFAVAEGDGRSFFVASDGVYQQLAGRQEVLTAAIAPFFRGETVAGQPGWNTDVAVKTLTRLTWHADPLAPFLLMLYADSNETTPGHELYLGKNPATGRYEDISFDYRSANTTLRALSWDPNDAQLYAGSAQGEVFVVEDPTATLDHTASIAWEVTSPSEHHEAPHTEVFVSQVLLEVAATNALTVEALYDRQTLGETLSVSVTRTESTATVQLPTAEPEAPRHDVALRLSGSLTARVDLYRYGWLYEIQPEPLTFWDSGIIELGYQTYSLGLWYTLRALADVMVRLRCDEQAETLYTINSTQGDRLADRLFCQPGTRGRTVRVTLSSTAAFRVYDLRLRVKPYGTASGAQMLSLLGGRT